MTVNRMKESKYVITAVNKMTGEREVISNPHSRWKTEEMLTKARRDTMRHHKKACYALHRMEEWHGDQRIDFGQ